MSCGSLTRVIITLLHFMISAGCGLCVAYTLIRWKSASNCLPPMVEASGGILEMKTQTPDICESMLISLSAIFFFSGAMCAFVNCLWNHACFKFLHLFMTLLMGVFVVFCASVFTVYKIVWCDHLTHALSTHDSCHEAAERYDYRHDTNNATGFYQRLHLQFVGLWSLVPIVFTTVLFYGLSMRFSEIPSNIVAPASVTEVKQSPTGASNDTVSNYNENTHLLINRSPTPGLPDVADTHNNHVI